MDGLPLRPCLVHSAVAQPFSASTTSCVLRSPGVSPGMRSRSGAGCPVAKVASATAPVSNDPGKVWVTSGG